MILYAAYVGGSLLDQVAAETEDTALSKLKMDYPELEGSVTFEIIDSKYVVEKEESTTVHVVEKKDTSKPIMKIIEAEKVEVIINVGEHSISKEDLRELEKAAEEGVLVARAKKG